MPGMAMSFFSMFSLLSPAKGLAYSQGDARCSEDAVVGVGQQVAVEPNERSGLSNGMPNSSALNRMITPVSAVRRGKCLFAF